MSKREELKKFAKRRFSVVNIDGTDVRLQSLTELERSNLQSQWGKRFQESDKTGQDVDPFIMRRELLVFSIVDDEGERIYELSDVPELGQWDPSVIEKLHNEARKLSKFDEDTTDSTEKKSEETTG